MQFSKFKCISQVVGTILKVICVLKWQLWWWNRWFDLVFDGSLPALLDSWGHMFGFLPVSLSVCVVVCLDVIPEAWVRTYKSLSPLYHLRFLLSFHYKQNRRNHEA